MSKLGAVTTAALKPVADLHQTVPKARLIEKYTKTVAGFFVLVGAFFLPKFLGIDRWMAYLLSGFGGFMMSQELVKKYLKIIPAAIGALKGAKTDG